MKKQCKKSVISKLFEYYLLPIVFVSILVIILSFFYKRQDDVFLIYQPFFMAFLSIVNVEIFLIVFYIKKMHKEMFSQWFIIIECLLFVFIACTCPTFSNDTSFLSFQYFILYPIVVIITMYVVILLKELIRRL